MFQAPIQAGKEDSNVEVIPSTSGDIQMAGASSREDAANM